jgi:hypothetical protein
MCTAANALQCQLARLHMQTLLLAHAWQGIRQTSMKAVLAATWCHQEASCLCTCPCMQHLGGSAVLLCRTQLATVALGCSLWLCLHAMLLWQQLHHCADSEQP